ncbi:methylenetetrahydrofolate reductase [Amycolatopsis cynarae]|uniref:Methylenetetrahydrofolate reductase n=1 Tax=Amycolatopsis cynarae TaxID=2995223 RepID=A0ABY7B630_9PSEU|nr:methylenetetrahydrofolate reductase [Amycolatopsis sp. HUAS 11-8]WAL67796.1 methylenetetrahydrofolate reductase [Amycolatopsis sp. HUAS 11-8]
MTAEQPATYPDVDERLLPLLNEATMEVVPVKGAQAQILATSQNATVAVTCSPKFGLGRTLEHCAMAAKSGRRVVPHLAARMVADRASLRDFVRRLADLGVTDLYVVGGDATTPVGRYREAAELLDDLSSMEHPFTRIGIACYPEGHPHIDDDRLWEALLRKQDAAGYLVSQMCFDAATLTSWLRRARERGVSLPIRIGIAGPLKVPRLTELSLRIGVGRSLRFLAKQHGLVGNVLMGRTYDPAPLVRAVLAAEPEPGSDIEGLHVFTFNQVPVFQAWLRTQAGATA